MQIHTRSLAFAALVTAAWLVLPGCPVESAEKTAQKNVKWSMRRNGDDAYLAGRAKVKQGANSILVLPRDLRPPFRCEVTAGLFNPKRADGVMQPAIFGMELDTPGRVLPPPNFYFVSAQLLDTGISVWSGSHLTAPQTAGQAFFGGVSQARFAIEHDGAAVRFYARPLSTQTWTALGSVDPAGQPFPVHPTLGIFNGAKPGEIGFDDFRVVENGPRDGGMTAEETLIEDLWDAIDQQTLVAHALDDDAPDLGALTAVLADAAEDVDDAFDALTTVAQGPGKKTVRQIALKRLKTGRKQLASARGKLDKGKKPRVVAKKLEKAVTFQFRAIFELQHVE